METIEHEPLQVTVKRLMYVATPLYSHAPEEWPYHNYEHAGKTFEAVMDIADIAEEYGVKLDRRVLAAAAWLHDANFHLPLPPQFSSKEEWSAEIAANLLPAIGYTDSEIEHVKECIMATRIGSPEEEARLKLSLEAKAVVRADLANVVSDYKVMRSKTIALYKEGQLCGSQKSFTEWAPISISILRAYASRDLSLGTWDIIGGTEYRFEFLATGNIVRLEKDIPAIAAELELAA